MKSYSFDNFLPKKYSLIRKVYHKVLKCGQISKTRSGPLQKERKKYMTKFAQTKALVALSFTSVIWALVTFR